MSSRAIDWVCRQSELANGPFRVLALMADVAGDHDCSWLKVVTLMAKSGMKRSTVLAHIRELHAQGYIVPGDKRYVGWLPVGQRPSVWQMNINRGTPGDLRGQTLFDLDSGSDAVDPPVDDSVDNQGRGPNPRTSRNPDPSRSTHLGGPSSRTQNLNKNPTSEKAPAQPHLGREAVSDLGQPTPGAVSAQEALDRIAACRAAIRKDQQ